MRAVHRSLFTASVLVLLTTAQPAAAQAVSVPGMPVRQVFFGLFGGLTYGGDRLATVQFFDGASENVRGGSLVQVGAGLLWEPAGMPWLLQATISYHADNVLASNGDVTWSRVPFEVLGYYTGVPSWRFGGGVRFVSAAQLKADLGAFTDRVKYRDTTGFVLEAGFRVGPGLWINGRYIREDYEAESVNGEAFAPAGKSSGNSFGVNVVVLF